MSHSYVFPPAVVDLQNVTHGIDCQMLFTSRCLEAPQWKDLEECSRNAGKHNIMILFLKQNLQNSANFIKYLAFLTMSGKYMDLTAILLFRRPWNKPSELARLHPPLHSLVCLLLWISRVIFSVCIWLLWPLEPILLWAIHLLKGIIVP